MGIRRYDDFDESLILTHNGAADDDGTNYYIQDHDNNAIFGSVVNYMNYKGLHPPGRNDTDIMNVSFPHFLVNNFIKYNYVRPLVMVQHGNSVVVGGVDPIFTNISGTLTWTCSPSGAGTFTQPVQGSQDYAIFNANSNASGFVTFIATIPDGTKAGILFGYII